MIKPYYETDNGKLYHGDCLEILPQLDVEVDLVLTDPPYELDNTPPGKNNLSTLGKAKSNKYKELCYGFNIEETFNKIKQEKVNMFVFCSNKQIPEIMSYGLSKDFYTTLLVWNKYNSPPFANGVWRQDLEFIVHIREKGGYFEGGSEIKKKCTVLPYNSTDIKHPTVKPTELINKYIKIGSKENDLILDPFLGSGTTAVAAESLNRRWIGIEREQKYCDIAIERLKNEVQYELF